MNYNRCTRTRVPACILTLTLLVLCAGCGDAQGAGTAPQAAAKGAGAKVPDLLWSELGRLNVKTGGLSPRLRELKGKVVRIPGFAIPLEDEMEYMSEFLLVPYPMACVHVPSPPPNQIVHVKMAPGRSIKTDWWNPIWVRGRLRIAPSKSDLARASFRLRGESTEPYKDKRDIGNDAYPPPDNSMYDDPGLQEE